MPVETTVAAHRFEATGLVLTLEGPLGYAVLPDGRTYLQSAAGPVAVPPELHGAIRAEHPELELDFPQEPLVSAAPVLPDPVPAPAVPPSRPGVDLRWVDPQRINLVFGGTDLPIKEFLRSAGPVEPGDWDTPHRQTFAELDIFRAIEARITRGRPWEESDFYERVLRAIAQGKRKWGCTSVEDFQERLTEVDGLIESMRRDGFRTQDQLGGPASHEIEVAIRRDGRLLFLDGRHRLSIARVLGLAEVPVRIVTRHEEWERFKDRIDEYASRRGGRIYQAIDHPDLEHIPAHHGTERIGMIRRAFEGYDPRGKKLLDIGTHWGYMAQQMERLGFECTAVEANKTCARFAEAIRVATESRFRVWHGSIFDFEQAEEQDAVLALSIFHHFIKTPELHDELTRFLRRLKAEVMIFEPHLHDPPAQMKGAFRNYPADEFCALVSEHAGFTQTEHLGVAPDGRSLFKLSR
jgi:hypothetical protein